MSATTPTKHITLTPRKKVDHRENLPEAYITFNQALLDDEKWTYRDLQKLALKLNIGNRGTRGELIERLLEWHKRQFNSDRRCAGSNFALLEVELPPSPPKDVSGNAKHAGVSPTLLSPLKSKPKKNQDGTPISILSASKKVNSDKKKLAFSIFNGTKIIPPRDAIRRKWLIEDGINPDEISESEDEELETLSKEIAFNANPINTSNKALEKSFTADGFTSAAEEDWLTSDISLPSNSPYAQKAPVQRSNSIGRKCTFDDEDTVDAENIPANVRPSPVNASNVINKPQTRSSTFGSSMSSTTKNNMYASNAFMKNSSKYSSNTLGNKKMTQSDAYDQEFIQGLGALSM